MSQAIHVFYEVHMSIAHKSATAMLDDIGAELGKHDVAVFINTAWTAAKILAHDGMMIYYRPPSGSISVESLRYIHTKLPSKLSFAPKLEPQLVKRWNKDIGSNFKAKEA